MNLTGPGPLRSDRACATSPPSTPVFIELQSRVEKSIDDMGNCLIKLRQQNNRILGEEPEVAAKEECPGGGGFAALGLDVIAKMTLLQRQITVLQIQLERAERIG